MINWQNFCVLCISGCFTYMASIRVLHTHPSAYKMELQVSHRFLSEIQTQADIQKVSKNDKNFEKTV